MSQCAYCGARAVNADHVIPKAVLRRWSVGRRTEGRPRLPRDFRHVTVPSCFKCNIAKGTRLLIPESWADRLDELNDLGIGTYRVWRGDAEALRDVCK